MTDLELSCTPRDILSVDNDCCVSLQLLTLEVYSPVLHEMLSGDADSLVSVQIENARRVLEAEEAHAAEVQRLRKLGEQKENAV